MKYREKPVIKDFEGILAQEAIDLENIREAGNPAKRQSAQDLLMDKISRFEKKLAALNLLQQCIPWETLSSEQDELLWSLFVDNNLF
jgi:hypothetical protein